MSNYTVFVADDERMAREGIAELIGWDRLGLTLAGTAPDGLTAFQEIVKLRPAIVITDIKMPKLNGLELIEKTQQELPDIIFIVLSGYGEFELAAQDMKFGVKHYLLKPSNEEEILEVLQEVTMELDILRTKELQIKGMLQQLADTSRSPKGISFYASMDGLDTDRARITVASVDLSLTTVIDEARQHIVTSVLSGDETELLNNLIVFFQALMDRRDEVNVTIGRCMELMEAVIKQAGIEFGYKGTNDSVRIWQMQTLQEIQHYITQQLISLMDSQKGLRSDKRSRLISRIKQLTAEHLQNRQLSLQWLAQHHLFLNSEYLGKLFRQETGQRYTQFLTILRMDKAKELIERLPQIKIYEIAERCGFDQDPQYFANVFKKVTGCSPVEYRKQWSSPIK